MGRERVTSFRTKDHGFRQYVPRIPSYGKIATRPACRTRPLEVDTLRQQEEVDAEAAIQRLTLFSFKCGQGHQEGKGLLEFIAARKKPIFDGIRGFVIIQSYANAGSSTRKSLPDTISVLQHV